MRGAESREQGLKKTAVNSAKSKRRKVKRKGMTEILVRRNERPQPEEFQ